MGDCKPVSVDFKIGRPTVHSKVRYHTDWGRTSFGIAVFSMLLRPLTISLDPVTEPCFLQSFYRFIVLDVRNTPSDPQLPWMTLQIEGRELRGVPCDFIFVDRQSKSQQRHESAGVSQKGESEQFLLLTVRT